MTIRNKGDAVDRLTGGKTPVAGKVEIHEMSITDGIMKMRALENGLELPPDGEVALKPGGYHIMLIGLESPLKEGTKVPMTLTFEKAGTVDVELSVEKIGTNAHNHDGGHHDGGHHGGSGHGKADVKEHGQ
jgi:copper(I)-binding protein